MIQDNLTISTRAVTLERAVAQIISALSEIFSQPQLDARSPAIEKPMETPSGRFN